MHNKLSDANEIGARFREEVESKLSAAQVAQILKVHRNTVANWYDTAQFSGAQIATLDSHGIDMGYVLFGTRGRPYEPQKDGGARGRLPPGVSIDDYVFIPFYDVEFGAGGGRFIPWHSEPKEWNAWRKNWLRKKGIPLDAKLFEATSIGDSMYPVILEEEVIMVNTSDTRIVSGAIYAIQIAEELICKYLRQLPNDMIEVSSENSAKHKPFTIRASEIGNGVQIVGHVLLPRRGR